MPRILTFESALSSATAPSSLSENNVIGLAANNIQPFNHHSIQFFINCSSVHAGTNSTFGFSAIGKRSLLVIADDIIEIWTLTIRSGLNSVGYLADQLLPCPLKYACNLAGNMPVTLKIVFILCDPGSHPTIMPITCETPEMLIFNALGTE